MQCVQQCVRLDPYEPKLFEVLDMAQTEDPNQIEN